VISTALPPTFFPSEANSSIDALLSIAFACPQFFQPFFLRFCSSLCGNSAFGFPRLLIKFRVDRYFFFLFLRGLFEFNIFALARYFLLYLSLLLVSFVLCLFTRLLIAFPLMRSPAVLFSPVPMRTAFNRIFLFLPSVSHQSFKRLRSYSRPHVMDITSRIVF